MSEIVFSDNNIEELKIINGRLKLSSQDLPIEIKYEGRKIYEIEKTKNGIRLIKKNT